MAILDAATLAVDTGNYFTAPVGTALPADLKAIADGGEWNKIGHTSLEDIMNITSDGGDVTVIGTLQNKQLRTRRAARSETFELILEQFDENALKLYFGANSEKLPDGTMSVPSSPVPTVCAFLAVFVDGDNTFGIYAPKVEIMRGDDIEMKDTESFVGLPLSINPLNHNGNDWAYSVTPLDGAAATADTTPTV